MDLIYTLYNDERTVFRLKDVALLMGETSFSSLNLKLNYLRYFLIYVVIWKLKIKHFLSEK